MRKGKRSVFLFVLALLFSPVSVFAYDWSEVLSAYLSVPINYPDSSAWIEKTATGGYNVWKRPIDSLWKIQITSTVYNAQLQGPVTQTSYLVSCGAYQVWEYDTREYLKQYLHNSQDSVSCMAQNLSAIALADSTLVTEIHIISGGCSGISAFQAEQDYLSQNGYTSPPPTDPTIYDCKSYDILINSFADNEVNNCENRSLSMSTDGSIDADPLISNSCQCTPAGTKYFETSSAGMCRYKNIVGDPSDPATNITIIAPGFTVMDSSDPVKTQTTNPDGTITVIDTVTNTYPDNTQSQDSTSVTTYPDNSIKNEITTGANIIGGVAIGGTSTTTLSGGGNTSTTTTYQSGLAATTTSIAGGTPAITVGTKKEDGGGGDIWAAPPATVTVPSIPSASSHTSEYSTTLDTVPENDIKTLIGNFISTSPIISAVQNTRIDTIDSECSFTSGDIFGSPVTLDFCSLDYLFSIFGVLFVVICTFRSFFILFGID